MWIAVDEKSENSSTPTRVFPGWWSPRTTRSLFQQITLDYFAKLAPDTPPSLGEPYLQFGEPEVLDYTSLVKMHGEYDGCIYLTSPIPMLEKLLAVNDEPEVSARTLEDMCRELSNVLAGNASQAFGGHWEISVPVSLSGPQMHAVSLPDSTFVMPVCWCESESFLVVGLTRPSGSTP